MAAFIPASCSKLVFSCMEDEKLVECLAKFPCIYDLSNREYKNQTVKDNAWREVSEYVTRSVEDCKKRWRNIKDTYIKRQKKGKSTGSSTFSKPKPWPLADMLSFLGKVDYKRASISNILPEDIPIQDNTEDIEMQENTVITVEDMNEQSECEVISDHNLSSIPSIFNDSSVTTLSTKQKCRRQKQEDRILDMLKDRQKERNDIVQSLSEIEKERNGIVQSLSQIPEDEIDLFCRSIAISLKKLQPQFIPEAKLKMMQIVYDFETCNTDHTYSFSANSRSSFVGSPSQRPTFINSF